MKRPLVACALCAALCESPEIGVANPLDLYGFGSRSVSLGGAVSAEASDFSANYYNPAGLARARGLSGELGYFYVHHALSTDGRDNGLEPAHGVVGGLVAPGRLFGLPFAFGVAFHLPDDRLSLVRALPQGQPRWELYDVRVQRVYIAANLAVSPVSWLRLGGGVAFMSSTRGSLDIEGRIAFPNASSSQLTHTVDADLTAVRYPQAGVQVDLGRGVTVGLTWRGRFQLDLALDARLVGQVVLGNVSDPRATTVPGRYVLRSLSSTAFQPEQGVLGVAWRIDPRWLVVADVTYVRWSEYPNPTAALDVGLELRVPEGIPGLRTPTVPRPTERVALGFSDTLVPRLGVEHTRRLGRHDLALRAGYRYDPSPVPDQVGVTNLLDADRHVFALGVGLSLNRLGAVLPGSLRVDAHLDVQYLPPRAFLKASPTDPIGDQTVTGTVWNAGATVGLVFP